MKILEKDTHEAKLLVIGGEEDAEEFARKMICHVRDPLFLPPAGPSAKTLCEGGFGCDISGLVTLQSALMNRTLTAAEITAMIIRTANAILVLEAHLLGDENILLSPERIYVRPGSLEPVFCPAFSAEESFEQRFRPFMRELFLHADTGDPQTLRLASELLKVTLRKQYRMHDLLEMLEKGNGRKVIDGGGTVPAQMTRTLQDKLSEESLSPAPESVPVFRPGHMQDDFPAAQTDRREFCGEEWPDEERPAGPGFFGRIKGLALSAAAWVMGDDEPPSSKTIRFEDHT